MAVRFPLRPRLVLPFVAAMTAAAALLAFASPAAEDASAHAGHPGLVYDMEVNWAFSGQCLSYGPPDGCNVGTGRVFQVRVAQATNHGLTFDEVQFALEYSGVTPKGTPDVSVLDQCDTRTDPYPQPAGKVVAGCTLDPAATGALTATFEFTCTQTPSSGHVLTLRDGIGPEETYIQDTGSEKHSAEEADTITVNCLDAPTAGMNLNAKGPNASCDDALDPAECDVDVGSQFTLAVETSDPPAGGYAHFATRVEYGSLVYKPAGPDNYYTNHNEGAEMEITWPDRPQYDLRFPFQPTGTEGYVVHGAEGGQPDYAGNLLELAMTCTSAGAYVVSLPAYDPPAVLEGASFSTDTERVYLNSGDELTINCIAAAPPPAPTPAPTPASVGGISMSPPVDGAGGPSEWPLLALGAISLVAAAGGVALRLRARR